ncbi:helix-turn-helix domain-containing protein [Sungkyunkwania multivorans]|uniref:Helix-turn-helix domain-containing protein n=1 Tax=Sungkyunkwania multivorans TaxID=1173618 RepID=A0ABW3D0F4_9FLAO
MKVVPQAFYKHPKIEKVLMDGLSCVILKSITEADLQNERYLAAHALTLVLSGALRVEDASGNLTIVYKNQMVLLPKGIYAITDIIPHEGIFEAVVFFFDEEITDEFLSSFDHTGSDSYEKRLVINYNHQLRLFVDTLLTLYRGKQQNQFTRSKLLELLHLVALSIKDSEFAKRLVAIRSREKVPIMTFMQDNFAKPLDVIDYAYLSGRSVSTFQRDFKSRFGISPKKWLIEKRLEKAATLFKTTSDSVTSVMLAVGFENSSHFIKTFHKRFGLSPKQFQLRHRKDLYI